MVLGARIAGLVVLFARSAVGKGMDDADLLGGGRRCIVFTVECSAAQVVLELSSF